jgi:CheY-like chemotaxis protein
LSPRLVDANLLVSDTVRLLPKLLGERIKVELRPAESLWKTVVDPGRLETTLVSLALNARDAMPNGGRLVVETANRSLDREDAGQFGDVEAGDYVLISVRDDGCGMAPETAERAFEPFFTTKPFGTGKGLGLSMVFGFVKQSGGHVALDSALGRGTTITIFLPRAPQQEISARPRFLAPAAAPGGKTVLFVEDEPAVSAVAQAFFDKLGYKILAVPDGPQAVQILQGGEPVDLLFTDVMLPEGMTGKEIADAARRLRPGIKVLFVSGYATDMLQSEGRLDADSILLQKPYRRADLAEALRKLG